MVAYLSDDWVRSLDEALHDVAPAVAGPTVRGGAAATTTVQFVVQGGPYAARAWHLTLGPTGARAVVGSAATPTVTFTQPWATALAVARGARGIREALLAGDVRVSGDPTRLLPWRPAVDAVQASMARLNARTTYPIGLAAAEDAPDAADQPDGGGREG